jgi:hypothetical protein
MSDMNTARKAGGNNIPFTLAVILVILLIAGGFVWRAFHVDSELPPQATASRK